MCLGHVYIVLEAVESARLKFGIMMCFDVPKVVRSPGCDHRHNEASRNGRDMNIDILEGYVWTPKWFRMSSGIYQSTEGLPEPPGGLMGLLSGREKERGADPSQFRLGLGGHPHLGRLLLSSTKAQ